MSIYRYPWASLLSDGVRAAFGIIATFGPLAYWEIAWPLTLLLGLLALLFLAFAVRVAGHGLSSIELSDEGIARRGPIAFGLAWRDLRGLKLAHYATPRRSSSGWYQLTLKGDRGRLNVESTIDGFDDIVTAAVRAARSGGLELDPATAENLRGLGHR